MPEQEVVDAILEYLEEHPQASDTLEGIAEWWIMRRQVRAELDALQNALRQLTESGVLVITGEGDRSRYQLKAKEYDSHS